MKEVLLIQRVLMCELYIVTDFVRLAGMLDPAPGHSVDPIIDIKYIPPMAPVSTAPLYAACKKLNASLN